MMEVSLAAPGGIPLPRLLRRLGQLCRRAPRVTLREWRKRRLRLDYLHGSAHPVRQPAGEEMDPLLVSTGQVLRRKLLSSTAGRHAALGYRVLMLRPRSLTSEIWLGDLQLAMAHVGIECQVLPPGTSTADVSAAFEEFQPNVFITTEAPDSLGTIDLPGLLKFKRRHGCLRMFIPVWHAHTPRRQVPSGRSTRRQDEWRRELQRRGLSADVHYSIFEPEFHEQFSRDRQGPAVEYVAIPMACNPFVDFPVAAVKRYDYFMAASMTDERVEVSHAFLRPVLRQYRGLWAGPAWGFGRLSIPPAEMPDHYARTRIALSPLVGFVHRYSAELTHRVYAAAACGAFQLTLATRVTDRFFGPHELVRANSAEEYARLFDHYVDRPDERNAIALAALRRAYAEHTCLHRVDRMVSCWNDWRRRGFF